MTFENAHSTLNMSQNRYVFTYNSSAFVLFTLKKHTHKTQIFLTTPFHTKNNNYIKKDTYKFNTYITLFIVIIFLKITNTYKKHTYKP